MPVGKAAFFCIRLGFIIFLLVFILCNYAQECFPTLRRPVPACAGYVISRSPRCFQPYYMAEQFILTPSFAAHLCKTKASPDFWRGPHLQAFSFRARTLFDVFTPYIIFALRHKKEPSAATRCWGLFRTQRKPRSAECCRGLRFSGQRAPLTCVCRIGTG